MSPAHPIATASSSPSPNQQGGAVSASCQGLEDGATLPVHAQGVAHVQVVLAGVVAQVEVEVTHVSQRARGGSVARDKGHAGTLLARAVRTAQVTVDLGIADGVVGAVFVQTTALSAVSILKQVHNTSTGR